MDGGFAGSLLAVAGDAATSPTPAASTIPDQIHSSVLEAIDVWI